MLLASFLCDMARHHTTSKRQVGATMSQQRTPHQEPNDSRNTVLLQTSSRLLTTSGAHTATCPVGFCGFCPKVKRSGREVNQSPPTSVTVKNEWSYTSTPLMYSGSFLCYVQEVPQAVVSNLLKPSGNFTYHQV
jgi:hypothetical protein